MENILLSLLLIKSMTIYEMKMFIEKYLNTVCSSSLGSLQAALKKLVQCEKVTIFDYEEKGHLKKEYKINENGVQQFLTWIQTPMNWNKAKNMEEGKFFFLGMLPKEKRIEMLKKLIEDLENEQQSLKQIQYFIEMTKDTMVQRNVVRMQEDKSLVKNVLFVSGEMTLDKAVENIGNYQCYMLEYGLEKNKTDIEFFKSIYEREVSNENEK